MKFSRLLGSLLIILATPLALLADGIKFDNLDEGTLVTNRFEHRIFSDDSDEHLQSTEKNLWASLSDSICATVHNNVLHVSERDGIKTKKNAKPDCDGEQALAEPVSLAPRIGQNDVIIDPAPTAVPEPASVVLLGAGLLTLVGYSRRRLLGR
jgi:hypothetical protein